MGELLSVAEARPSTKLPKQSIVVRELRVIGYVRVMYFRK